MSTVHIVRNQDGHYWGRGKRWVDGRETGKVAAWPHRDEAVNTVFELSSKDIDLRCEVMVLNLEEGKLPKLEISEVPLPDDENGQLPLPAEDTNATAENTVENAVDSTVENAVENAVESTADEPADDQQNNTSLDIEPESKATAQAL